MNSASEAVRVSIGMPVYNAERYLAETLDSVLAQTYSNFILYIADNASTDRTQEICEEYCRKDSRIVYIRNPINLGAAGNYERCFQPATTEYFRWQNADDPIEPTLIEKCIKVLDENPDTVLAYGKAHIIDEHGKLLEHYDDNLELLEDSAAERFIHCLESIGLQNLMYGLIRRDSLANTARLGGYVAADINLIAELSLYGKFREIPDHLFNRRMHPECSSWDRKDDNRQKDFWDPSKRKLIMQTWRSIYEFVKAAITAPISWREKQIVLKRILQRVYRRRQNMMQELVDLIKFGLFKAS